MNNQQVQNFFYDKKDTPCPITESLIKSGYQQEREGYIAYAKEHGVEVNYLEAKPTQWWYLIKCYFLNQILLNHSLILSNVGNYTFGWQKYQVHLAKKNY